MEQIDKKNGRVNVNFLYTHPTFTTRIEVSYATSFPPPGSNLVRSA